MRRDEFWGRKGREGGGMRSNECVEAVVLHWGVSHRDSTVIIPMLLKNVESMKIKLSSNENSCVDVFRLRNRA
jgi:hypothetical protein